MSLFRVIDLKQFVYCPRLIYYHYCLPRIRPITYKMEMGVEAQADEQVREFRRSLKPYGLKRGERLLNLQVESDIFMLRGKVDLAIRTDDNATGREEIIPIDYKNSRRKRGNKHHKLQLMAYGLLLEEQLNLPAQRGFLYYIPLKQVVEVAFTARLKAELRKNIDQMRAIALQEQMPEPTRQRGKCVDCEFRRFCNDI